MAVPYEKLAASLEILRSFQKRGAVAVRSRELTRTHRERLVRSGFRKEIIKGWYREMFGPEVAAGLIKPADLAGYRNGQVFIRRSRHVPPRYEVVRDCMPPSFDLPRDETQPPVRIVLGSIFTLTWTATAAWGGLS